MTGAPAPNVVIVPPQNAGAEEAVLGAVLLAGGSPLRALLEDGLRAEHFYRPSRGVVFDAMAALHGRDQPIDLVTVLAELEAAGQLAAAGGQVAVECLVGPVPALGALRRYGEIIRDEAAKRTILTGSYEVQAAIQAGAPVTEIRAIAERVLDGAQVGPRLRWRRLNLAEVIALADVEPPWRCGELAADGYLTVIAGQGGEGKSWLTLALAGGVLQGSTIAGMIACRSGRVAIFDAENGPPLIGARLKSSGLPLDGLTVYDAAGIDLRADHDAIAAELDGVQLAIFDSLRTLAPNAKENESDEMAPVMNALRMLARDTGAAIVVVHHAGRNGSYRGSSVIRDQTDLMFTLGRDEYDPEGSWRRYVRCLKCRIAREPDDLWFGLRSWRGEMTLTATEPYVPEGRAAPVRDELADQALELLTSDGPLRQGEVARRLGRDKQDRSVRRALNGLRDRGLATYFEDSGWGVSSPVATPARETPGEVAHAPGADGVSSDPMPPLPPVEGWQGGTTTRKGGATDDTPDTR